MHNLIFRVQVGASFNFVGANIESTNSYTVFLS